MVFVNGQIYTWWENRHGQRAQYWTSSAPGGNNRYCECGQSRSCIGGFDAHCNCDINSAQWTSDSGVITDKSDLPVTAMRFGDLSGDKEEGYATLGKLYCYD